ncbi:MAG: hypothetical protein IAG10_10395, partial [Planctomycetaceae bacterium]|nr:hypothetical protein [Planctomycetaceae bacterium]
RSQFGFIEFAPRFGRLLPVASVASTVSVVSETPKRKTTMILRAWHHWLRTIKPQKPSARRRFLSRGVESLEVRCLPAVTVSGSATAPVLTVTNGDDLVISQNGANLTYDLGLGAGAVAFGGAQGSVTSLRITCSSSSSSSGNTIQLALSSSDGLSGSFRVTVTGNGGADLIDASATDFPVSLNGGSMNDTLMGGSGNDTLDGSTNDDQLTGGDGSDTLFGNSGNDVLSGGDGDDDLDGGTGNDDLSGNAGDDLCLGGNDRDTISGGDDNDVVNGQAGDDSVMGDEGNDYVYGGAGADYVDGGGGANIVKGQGGRDTVAAGSWSGLVADRDNFRLLSSSETWRGLTADPSRANLDSRDTTDSYA